MLALTVTLVTAVYLLGPDFLSRYILGFVVPRRTIQQTKGEEIARAILTSVVPFILACCWMDLRHVVDWGAAAPHFRSFFLCIYSESIFEKDPDSFLRAVPTVTRVNWSLIWRMYLIVVGYAVLVDVVIYNYGNIRNSSRFTKSKIARELLAIFILPRVSEWHILLTTFSNPKSTQVKADILTKSDILYKASIERPILAPDGSLTALLLSNPTRFKRNEYLEAKASNAKTKDRDFWKPIPSQTFLLMADEIATINLRHVPTAFLLDQALLDQLQHILKKKLTAQFEPGMRKPEPEK